MTDAEYEREQFELLKRYLADKIDSRYCIEYNGQFDGLVIRKAPTVIAYTGK